MVLNPSKEIDRHWSWICLSTSFMVSSDSIQFTFGLERRATRQHSGPRLVLPQLRDCPPRDETYLIVAGWNSPIGISPSRRFIRRSHSLSFWIWVATPWLKPEEWCCHPTTTNCRHCHHRLKRDRPSNDDDEEESTYYRVEATTMMTKD